ncbi:MAG: SMP-30/gluconolactonase/LRE family protein, partial [Turicibacter sp.]
MKRIIKLTLVFVMMLLVATSPVAQASPATSYTYTFNAKRQLVRTQDAYLPNLTITGLGLSDPSDMFIDHHDLLYIADTGNKRIVVYDIEKGIINKIITHESLTSPTGVYVTQDGEIYVADPSAGVVFNFDNNGKLIQQFGKPTSVAFGDTAFKPLKVAVDRAKNLFIVGEGVYNGIIQLSNSGEFLGYFTSNKVALSVSEAMQDLFFTDSQKQGLMGRVPLTFSNVYVDPVGIVYTTTASEIPDAIKKHNTAGSNMLQESRFMSSEIVDIYVDELGIIYAASLFGSVSVYTSEGDFIYFFGTSNKD